VVEHGHPVRRRNRRPCRGTTWDPQTVSYPGDASMSHNSVPLAVPRSPINSLCASTVSASREQPGPLPSTRCLPQSTHRFWPNSSTASPGAWLNEPNSSEQTGETTSPYEYSRNQIRGLHTNSNMRLRQSLCKRRGRGYWDTARFESMRGGGMPLGPGSHCDWDVRPCWSHAERR
jgi:hypothetical protein